jgi:hypothetical protein
MPKYSFDRLATVVVPFLKLINIELTLIFVSNSMQFAPFGKSTALLLNTVLSFGDTVVYSVFLVISTVDEVLQSV